MDILNHWLVAHRSQVRIGWLLLLVLLAACNENDDGGGIY